MRSWTYDECAIRNGCPYEEALGPTLLLRILLSVLYVIYHIWLVIDILAISITTIFK